jgi:hypothetical protein
MKPGFYMDIFSNSNMSEQSKLLSFNNSDMFKFIKKILPVLFLVAILPVTYGFFIKPNLINFSPQADQIPQLSVWFEPANVIVKKGEEVELTAYAEFEGGTKVINKLNVKLEPDPFLNIEPLNLDLSTPFRGKVVLGKVRATSNISGKYSLSIPNNAITVTDSDIVPEITTSPVTLTVK